VLWCFCISHPVHPFRQTFLRYLHFCLGTNYQNDQSPFFRPTKNSRLFHALTGQRPWMRVCFAVHRVMMQQQHLRLNREHNAIGQGCQRRTNKNFKEVITFLSGLLSLCCNWSGIGNTFKMSACVFNKRYVWQICTIYKQHKSAACCSLT
jgi:hypothetical protein